MGYPQRKRLRLQGFDYATPGCYFVTITTKRRGAWFGHVADGRVHLNAAGEMAADTWGRLPSRYPGTLLDYFVIMPDHLHGIVVLGTEPDVPATPALSEIVGTFKSLTTIAYGHGVREHGWRPFDRHLWHRSYRDTVVRSDRALDAFRDYIEGNPGRWSEKYGR